MTLQGKRNAYATAPLLAASQKRRSALTKSRLAFVVAILVVVFCSSHRWRHGKWTGRQRTATDVRNDASQRHIRVFVHGHRLDDVWASVMQSLSTLPTVTTVANVPYLYSQDASEAARPNFQTLVEDLKWANKPQWLTADQKNEKAAVQAIRKGKIDVVIATDCSDATRTRNSFLETARKETDAFLYCLVRDVGTLATSEDHDAQREDLLDQLWPWMEAQRVRLVTLGDHLRDTINEHWSYAASLVTISSFAPVVDFSILQTETSWSPPNGTSRIAVAGHAPRLATDAYRQSTITALRHELAEAGKTTSLGVPPFFTLLGDLQTKIPGETNPAWTRQHDLDIIEYYRSLANHSSLAILLPNATLDSTTSPLSTYVSRAIFVALSTGTPLVADAVVQETYSALTRSVFVTHVRASDSLITTAMRHHTSEPLHHNNIRESIQMLRVSLLLQNKYMWEKWLIADV